MKPRLRFKENRIYEIASRYEYGRDETEILELGTKVQERGFLTKDQYPRGRRLAARLLF